MKVRKGVMFPEKPGVMKKRELTAEDIVFTYNRLNTSPKKLLAYFDHVDQVEAADSHTVVFYMKHYFAEWDYRFGWGYYSAIHPKEVADAGANNWKNVNGTGPYMLTDFISGNSNIYIKNPDYWDKEKIGGTEYKLPFVDKITYRTIKDEATFITALRTGKLDMLEAIRWQNVDSLKKSAPQLQWNRWLNQSGTFMAMRIDVDGPFKDIRVRRALNYAVNKDEIVKAYYNGNAELFAYPQHPDYVGYFEPLDKQPASVQELFKYDPAKAKKLLAEAGFPKGFTTKVQVCSCNPDHMDLLPLVAGYLEQVGVKLEIQPLEYGAFLSAMTSRTHTPAYFMNNGHTNPTHDHPQELRHGPAVESVGLVGPRVRQEDGRGLPRARRGQAPEDAARDDHRDPRQGALHLAAHAVHLFGVVAVGEELSGRAARRRGAARPDLRPHLGRPGAEEEDGLLINWSAASRSALR